MRITLILSLSVASVGAFNTASCFRRTHNVAMFSTMADSGVPPATSDATDVEDINIPTNLPSDVGMDYVPLATMLATGQLAEADQVGLHFSCGTTTNFVFSRLSHSYTFEVYSRRLDCLGWK